MRRPAKLLAAISLGAAVTFFSASPVLAQVSPENAALLQNAQQALQSGNAQQAASLAQQFVTNQPGEGDGYRILAAAQHQLGNTAAAREALVQALSLGRATEDVLARLVQIDRAEGRPESIAAAAGMLIMLDPANTTWRLVRAQALFDAGQFEAARRTWEGIANASPADASTWAHLANAAAQLNDIEAAAEYFETAYHLGHRDPRLPVSLARLHLNLDQPQQALDWHTRASQLGSTVDDQLTLSLATALVRNQRYEEAVALLNPMITGAERRLRLSATDQGGPSAIDANGAQTDPAASTAARAHVLLATIAADQDHIADAITHLETAVALGHADPTPMRYIANHYLGRGDHAKAAEYLTRAVNAGATDAQTLGQLIGTLLKIDRPADARTYLSQYLELYSRDEHAAEFIRALAGK